MSAQISYTEPGTKVAEITISGINNFSGEAGLIWKEQSPNQCVIYSLDSNSPWFTTERTSQGNFESPSSSPLPVELSLFTATVEDNDIILNWTTETETNNYGFDIERQVFSSQSAVHNFVKVGFVSGYGNSNSQKNYRFVDTNVNPGKYSYRLKQIDIDGSYSYSEVLDAEVQSIPNTFSLEQNYPNPFNPATKIKYSIPSVETRQVLSLHRVTLKVYDILGNEVSKLVDEFKDAGSYEVVFDASSLASGFYIYKLTAGNFTSSKKMLLIK
ncbi:MAG: T9SS type A sorting domain-containing protein [Ignavibacteriales bacterium]|nr:MAG: T9SS type A sorting domain-containing protein [Ignavibacteriales bacterium]